MLNSWTEDNPSTTQHRIGNESVNFLSSSRMIEKGSYLRIKEMQFGYSFSPTILSKIAVESLRLYISANNLYTFTNYSGFDPEIGAKSNSNLNKGIDVGNYPQPRMFFTGIEINF